MLLWWVASMCASMHVFCVLLLCPVLLFRLPIRLILVPFLLAQPRVHLTCHFIAQPRVHRACHLRLQAEDDDDEFGFSDDEVKPKVPPRAAARACVVGGEQGGTTVSM